jgi:hypothetical protein
MKLIGRCRLLTMNNDAYMICKEAEGTCVITFFFDDGASVSMPTRNYPELESDIRHNYYAWRAHAYAYTQQRARIDAVLDVITRAGAERESHET